MNTLRQLGNFGGTFGMTFPTTGCTPEMYNRALREIQDILGKILDTQIPEQEAYTPPTETSAVLSATADGPWTDGTPPYVMCDSGTVKVYLPRTWDGDPNVTTGDTIYYAQNSDTPPKCYAICDYMDDKIGTVKFIKTTGGIPRAWQVYTGVTGHFLYGSSTASAATIASTDTGASVANLQIKPYNGEKPLDLSDITIGGQTPTVTGVGYAAIDVSRLPDTAMTGWTKITTLTVDEYVGDTGAFTLTIDDHSAKNTEDALTGSYAVSGTLGSGTTGATELGITNSGSHAHSQTTTTVKVEPNPTTGVSVLESVYWSGGDHTHDHTVFSPDDHTHSVSGIAFSGNMTGLVHYHEVSKYTHTTNQDSSGHKHSMTHGHTLTDDYGHRHTMGHTHTASDAGHTHGMSHTHSVTSPNGTVDISHRHQVDENGTHTHTSGNPEARTMIPIERIMNT